MSFLSVFSRILSYSDAASIANPSLRNVDWSRKTESASVDRPKAESFEIPPGETLELFSGVRSTAIDGTSAFDLAVAPSGTGVYRLTSVSGTAPAFRTDRALALTGETVTVTTNNNATASFALSHLSAGDFSDVVVGDVVFVSGTLYGDGSSPFSPLNAGFWTVIGKGAVSGVPDKKLMMVRQAGSEFEGAAEVVVLTSNTQLNAYSAAGVQVGDRIELSAGFSSVSWQMFEVSAVTPWWLEFLSGANLPLEEDVQPGAAGVTIYKQAKRFVRLEVDREAAVRLNGDTSNKVRVSPIEAGNAEQAGWIELWGSAYSLSVVNRDPSQPLKGILISGE